MRLLCTLEKMSNYKDVHDILGIICMKLKGKKTGRICIVVGKTKEPKFVKIAMFKGGTIVIKRSNIKHLAIVKAQGRPLRLKIGENVKKEEIEKIITRDKELKAFFSMKLKKNAKGLQPFSIEDPLASKVLSKLGTAVSKVKFKGKNEREPVFKSTEFEIYMGYGLGSVLKRIIERGREYIIVTYTLTEEALRKYLKDAKALIIYSKGFLEGVNNAQVELRPVVKGIVHAKIFYAKLPHEEICCIMLSLIHI